MTVTAIFLAAGPQYGPCSVSVIAKGLKISGAEATVKKKSEEMKAERENKAAMMISFAKFKRSLLFGKVNLAAKRMLKKTP